MVNLLNSIQNTLHEIYHPYACVAKKLKALRDDPEFFQRICQVVSSALLIKSIQGTQPSPLSELSHVFSAVNLQDVYRLFEIPFRYYFPINIQTLDDKATLTSLIKVLCIHFDVIFEESDAGHIVEIEDENIKFFAETFLEKQLKSMEESGDAYRTADEFKAVLQKYFQQLKVVNRDLSGVDTPYDFGSLDLDELQVALTPPSRIAQLENFNWNVVNCSCLFLYLQEWNLMQTARWAENMGNYPDFRWFNVQSLEIWTRGMVCSAFSLKLCEAVRLLWKEPLTSQMHRKACWDVAISIVELISNGAFILQLKGYWRANLVHLHLFTITAKGIGMMEILTRPSHKFFEEINHG